MEAKISGFAALLSQNIFSAIVVSSLCFPFVVAYYYYKNKYSYWSRKGVQGPPPWPVVGNLLQFLLGQRMSQAMEWTEKYGKVHGIYFGVKPLLMIADPEVSQQICIKDFDIWPNHEANKFFNEYQRNFLFFAQDDKWRKMRAFMSPTFTSGKIKRMFRLLNACADDLVDLCQDHINSSKDDLGKSAIVNAKSIYSLYTMDGIATCCYGLKLDRAGATDVKGAKARNDFVRIVLKIFEPEFVRLIISIVMPERLLQSLGFKITTKGKSQELISVVENLVKSRRNTRGKKFDDYLQLLLDTKLDHELELNEIDSSENHHAGLTEESLKADQAKMVHEVKNFAMQSSGTEEGTTLKGLHKIELSDLEILASAMFLLVVGMETTGSLLTNAAYILAFHQDIQEKLYESVKTVAEFSDDKKTYIFDYERLTTLKYLDAFVSETLRRVPPVIQIDRLSSADYRIEKYNIDLPAGSKINLVMHAMMNSPDYWEEPGKFNPDRFLPENRHKIVPGSYCPFGLGPRHCIGMRFSLTEAKLALAKLVMNFRFEAAPGTQWPPKGGKSFGLNAIVNPMVKIVPRAR